MRTKTFFLAAPLFPFTTAFAQPAGNHSNSSLCVKWVREAMALQVRTTPPPELAALGGRLMNCSWFVADNSEMLHDFIRATPDVLYVVAAGNAGHDLDIEPPPYYPQVWTDSHLMVVGNCEGDELSNSNRGAVSVDFFTPGALVRALNLSGVPIASGGTSAAAAVTTGISALIWTANPNITPVQIKQ